MSHRPAQDTTTFARVVEEVVLIDPATGLPYAAGVTAGGASEVTLAQVRDALTATATAIPPRGLAHDGGAAGMLIVPISGASPYTIEAADADEHWALFGLEVTVSAACTVTLENGTTDIAFVFPVAGDLSLPFREYPYARGALNAAYTITASAGTLSGAAYVAKSV